MFVGKALEFTESCLFVNEGVCDNMFMGTFHDLHMVQNAKYYDCIWYSSANIESIKIPFIRQKIIEPLSSKPESSCP